MGESASKDSEAPTYVIQGLDETYQVIRALDEHGAIIADVRALEEPTLGRVLDMLYGAAVAGGTSPFGLARGVYFLTTGRTPNRAEIDRYRDQAQ